MKERSYRIPWSVTASSFARHRAKKFDALFYLPERCPDRWKLGHLPIGYSHRFEFSAITKPDRSDIMAQVARFNRKYPMQFKAFKFPDHIEVARIA